jgi:hypothetical protein
VARYGGAERAKSRRVLEVPRRSGSSISWNEANMHWSISTYICPHIRTMLITMTTRHSRLALAQVRFRTRRAVSQTDSGSSRLTHHALHFE